MVPGSIPDYVQAVALGGLVYGLAFGLARATKDETIEGDAENVATSERYRGERAA
jgi:hypothetical protein